MTSKGAKVHIIDTINGDMVKEYFINEILPEIEKDLDVLDILKNGSDNKRIIVKNGIVSFHLDMILTNDNYSKVKEWLEKTKENDDA